MTKKYEYKFSFKSGFEPYKDIVVWADEQGQGLNLKKALEKIKDNLKNYEQLIYKLVSYLREVHKIKQEKIEDTNISLHDFEVKSSFVRKYIYKNFLSADKKKSFFKLDENTQASFINLLDALLECLKLYQQKISDELEKSLPSATEAREIIRKLLRNPDIAFTDNRLISTISFLLDIFGNSNFLNSDWQKQISTGKYREFELKLNEYFLLLSKRKEVLKASLNRATIGKSYTAEEIKQKIKSINTDMSASLQEFLSSNDLLTFERCFNDIKNTISECREKIFDIKKETLQTAATNLKKIYKSCIKKQFASALKSIFKKHNELSFDVVTRNQEIVRILPFIFDVNDRKFKEYFTRFLEAKQIHLSIDKSNSSEKELAAQRAGKLFSDALRKMPSDFIKIKDKVTRKYGQLRAQAKSLDNTRLFLSHLALLAFKKGYESDTKNCYIVFAPKVLLKKHVIHNTIRKSKDNSTHMIYELHSLTLDALRNKLIAKNISELKPYLNTEKYSEATVLYVMKLFICKFFLKKRICPIRIRLNDEIFAELMEKFKNLNFITYKIPDNLRDRLFNEVVIPSHANIEEFRNVLENNFYYFEKVNVNLDAFISILQKNLDNEGVQKNWRHREQNIFVGKVQFNNIKNRRYIKDFEMLLHDIASGNFNHSRLNPEITLFYTEKEPEKAKHEKNRYNKDRFTIQFNYTKNKPSFLLDVRFSDDEKLKQAYGLFNENINLQIKEAKEQGKYIRIGIDIGTSDFVSVVFLNDWQKERVIKKEGFPFKEVSFYKIKKFNAVGYIKSSKDSKELKKVVLWQNPSYFLHNDESKRAFKDKSLQEKVNPNDYIELVKDYTFDSSTAKVIDKKVVINADIASYLKLILIPIIERILTNQIAIKDIKNINFSKKGITFQGPQDLDGKAILQTASVAKEVQTLESFLRDQNILLDIIAKLIKETGIFFSNEEKIEYLQQLEKRLRKNIAANIIASLVQIAKNEQLLPEYFIESEHEAFLTDHESKRFTKKIQQSISREFPTILLRKLQKDELTPPRISRQFLLRELETNENLLRELKTNEKNKIHMQFGVVHFVSAAETSQLCPVCLKEKGKSKACDNCDFTIPDASNNYGVFNEDIQAAINIANPKLN